MKKILYYIIGAGTLLAAASCEKNPEWNEPEAQGLTLRFSCTDMATRATVPGVSNEDLIKKIDYFFFPVNAQGKVDDDTEYVYNDTFTPTDGGLTGTYSVVIQPGVLGQIFPNGKTKAMVFAIANYVDKDGAAVASPNTTIPSDVKTWKGLHDLEVGETFFYNDGNPNFTLRWPRRMNPDHEDLFFVMAGEQEVEFSATGSYAIDATVPLERLASKVTVTFTYQNYEEVKSSGNIMWVPQSEDDETRVFLSNAIERTTIGGPLTRPLVGDSGAACTKPQGNGTRDMFEYAYDFMNDIVAGEDGVKVAHYYTYPISLTEGNDNQPYLKLVLPWYGYKNYGTDQQMLYKQKEVYYKIVLPRETISEPNRIYEYAVDVNILGSDREIKIIGEEYTVKDWSSDKAISSNVATGAFISLDIPRDEYDMYTDLVEIAIVSSGEVEISDLKIYQDDFSSASSTQIDFITGKGTNGYTYGSGKSANTEDIDGNKLPEWVTVEGTTLTVHHAMNNDFSDRNFDAAPMTFIVTLHLKDADDDHTFDRTVTITQYPSLYVTKNGHTGHVFVNGYGDPDNNIPAWDNRGYQGANNNSSRRQYFLGNVLYQNADMTGGSSNNNPNNYTIHVTLLDNNSSGWMISDPRDVAGTLNYIDVTRYRKTKTDANDVISPGFKIASSYGMVVNRSEDGNYSGITYENAVKRCASYQENGYPAGRWRVPTEAEMEFVIYLSDYGKVPSLFQGSYYASSGRYLNYENGTYQGYANATSQYGYRVRCVYDTWFWGEEPIQENANTWLGFHD